MHKTTARHHGNSYAQAKRAIHAKILTNRLKKEAANIVADSILKAKRKSLRLQRNVGRFVTRNPLKIVSGLALTAGLTALTIFLVKRRY